MNSKIETNWDLPITAYLSKQKHRDKQRYQSSCEEFFANYLFEARQQIVKQVKTIETNKREIN